VLFTSSRVGPMSKLSTDTTDRTSKQALVGSIVLLLDLIAVTRRMPHGGY
jgi:hypothetical protein